MKKINYKKFINIRKCTQRAESPRFNSVGPLPYPDDFALSGQIANNLG